MCKGQEPPSRRAALIGWVVAFGAALALYIFTLAPDLVWWDAGYYQWESARLNFIRPGEAVRVHPWFLVVAHGLGRLGAGNYAYAANLAGALGTAIAAANIWLIVRLLGRRLWPAILGTAAFVLGHTVWQQAVQAQTYGWASAFITAMLLTAIVYEQSKRPRWLLLLFFLLGLGVSNHLLTALAGVVLAGWVAVRIVRRQTPAWVIPAAAGCFIVGAGLLWYIAILEYLHSESIMETAHSLLVGPWGGAIFNVSGLLRLAGRSVAAIGLNYPTPLALAAVGGIVWSVKERGSSMGRLLLVMAVVYFAFAVRYPIQPQHTFFVPFYAVCSILIGMGLAQIQIDKKRWRVALGCVLALLPIGVYAALPAAVRWADIHAVKAELARRVLPYRDPYRYFLQPWLRNYRGARRFAEEALAQVPQDAIILADNTSSAPLKYVQDVEGVRQDVMIVDLYDARFDPALEKYWHSKKNFLPSVSPKRVFIVSNVPGYFPEWIYRGCVLVKTGVLYEVKAEEDS